jgi:hypothetical protein
MLDKISVQDPKGLPARLKTVLIVTSAASERCSRKGSKKDLLNRLVIVLMHIKQ